MASLTAADQSTALTTTFKGETVAVALSGTYAATVALQREIGAPGSGAWEEIKRWSTANATVAYSHQTKDPNERLRLYTVAYTSGTVVATLTDATDKIHQEITDPLGNVLMRVTESGIAFLNSAGAQLWHSSRFKAVTDAAAITILEADSGKVHLMPDLTADATITLPAAKNGLNYIFRYVGGAADAHDWLFVAAAAAQLIKGGVLHLDTDAGAGADELVPVFANGSSHYQLDFDTPNVGTQIELYCDGTYWYATGLCCGVTAPAFA